jgi:hypothetical protein
MSQRFNEVTDLDICEHAAGNMNYFDFEPTEENCALPDLVKMRAPPLSA